MKRKIVLRLSPVAKVGCLAAVVGVGLGLWGRMDGPSWAHQASWPLVIAGAILYFFARARSIMKSRKL